MKKLVKVVAIVMIALAFSCSSDDQGSGTSGDAIVGTWKLVSSTENGVAVPPEECDDLESSEFKSNGDFIGKDYDLENGNCVLQEVNEPGVTVTTKWEKVADNSYKVKFTPLQDIMRPPKEQINYDETMDTIMEKFDRSQEEFLPVLKNNQVIGLLSKASILEAYRIRLKNMIIE